MAGRPKRGMEGKATMGSHFWLPPVASACTHPILPIPLQLLASHTSPLASQDELRPRHHRLQPRRPPLPGRVRHGGRPEGFDRRRSPGQGLRRPRGGAEGPRQVSSFCSWPCWLVLCVISCMQLWCYAVSLHKHILCLHRRSPPLRCAVILAWCPWIH